MSPKDQSWKLKTNVHFIPVRWAIRSKSIGKTPLYLVCLGGEGGEGVRGGGGGVN